MARPDRSTLFFVVFLSSAEILTEALLLNDSAGVALCIACGTAKNIPRPLRTANRRHAFCFVLFLQSFDDQKNYVDDVTDADFYKCIELNAELPGAGQLQVTFTFCSLVLLPRRCATAVHSCIAIRILEVDSCFNVVSHSVADSARSEVVFSVFYLESTPKIYRVFWKYACY